MPTRLQPKLITVFREGYTRKQFTSDLIAGVIVGIVALPLAIAFAIASGVKPEQGLYTAVIAGFIIGALGGTRAQISGPTGAFIVIIYGIVQQYGYDGLAVATIIAGFILVAMGLLRMGAFLKFIPYPVTVGFTTGIALIIFSGQIRDFFGLQMQNVPADFVEKWGAYIHAATSVNWQALVIGAASLAIVFLWPRITPKVPGSLVAIVLATAAVHLLHLNVETIGSRFGSVPNTLPAPHFPHLTWSLITKMFSPAITIALLAAIESLLAAVVADGMMGTRHRSNMELIAQGIGNVISPIFQGIPATGAIARTATNIKSGGRTPIAAIIHAVMLLLIMLFFGRWAALIPMPTLAAILIFVSYNMSEYHAFLKLLKSPKSDVAVLLVTFALTVLIDLTVAIQVGVVLAAFLFLQRMSEVSQVSSLTGNLTEEEEDSVNPRAISKRHVPAGVEVFEVYGSLFFGAIERFKDAMRRVEKKPKVLIIRMRMVPAIDATGLQVLEDVLERTRREGGTLMLTGVAAQPLEAIERSGLLEKIGRKFIFESIDDALECARQFLK
ncbi:MAG: sulfate permease [Acidobacteria bacterium]|nr:sulfate permease [Acidobacteriota bacterium]